MKAEKAEFIPRAIPRRLRGPQPSPLGPVLPTQPGPAIGVTPTPPVLITMTDCSTEVAAATAAGQAKGFALGLGGAFVAWLLLKGGKK